MDCSTKGGVPSHDANCLFCSECLLLYKNTIWTCYPAQKCDFHLREYLKPQPGVG